MQATYKLDNATFVVTFHEGYEEFTGECAWSTKYVHLAQMLQEGMTDKHLCDYVSIPDEYDDDDESELISNADALICFLAAASQADPHTYEIEYHGEPYWFFHDSVHAEYDSGDGSDLYVNEESEERALPIGAERAARHGVPIADIVRELAKAGAEFEDRFGYKFDPLTAFFDSVEVVLA